MKTNYLTEITIEAKCDWDMVWHVHCKETGYKAEGKNLTRMLATHAAEIEDKVQLANLNNVPVRKKRRFTIPDIGKRTPRVSLWQAPA